MACVRTANFYAISTTTGVAKHLSTFRTITNIRDYSVIRMDHFNVWPGGQLLIFIVPEPTFRTIVIKWSHIFRVR